MSQWGVLAARLARATSRIALARYVAGVRKLAILLVLGACGEIDHPHQADYLAYAWDDRRVLCSDAIDDLDAPVNWPFIDDQIRLAAKERWVLMLHAHTPTKTVSLDALDHALATADAAGLDYFTFRDFQPGEPRGGLALAFDDNAPDQWMLARDTLDKHHAHVTFFVSRWTEMTPLGHQEIAMLAADGHDIEPHTVDHLHATAYVAANGIDAYIADEVLPSFTVLEAAGYPPAAAFAYPFGDHDPAIDAAVLEHVERVRVTPGTCPWR